MRRYRLDVTTKGIPEESLHFDSDDAATFPPQYAAECVKIEALAVGESVPFGRGVVTRLEDEP